MSHIQRGVIVAVVVVVVTIETLDGEIRVKGTGAGIQDKFWFKYSSSVLIDAEKELLKRSNMPRTVSLANKRCERKMLMKEYNGDRYYCCNNVAAIRHYVLSLAAEENGVYERSFGRCSWHLSGLCQCFVIHDNVGYNARRDVLILHSIIN